MTTTPTKTNIRAVYASIASRIPEGDEKFAFTKKAFFNWMMMDDIAVHRATLTSLWYRIVGSPFTTEYNEKASIVTVDAERLASAVGIHTHIHTHQDGVCIHPVDGDRYIIIDDEKEVRE